MLDTYISLAHTFTVLRSHSVKMLSILLEHKREYCSPFVMHCPSQDFGPRIISMLVHSMVGANAAPDTHVKITSQPRAWTSFRDAEAANANARICTYSTRTKSQTHEDARKRKTCFIRGWIVSSNAFWRKRSVWKLSGCTTHIVHNNYILTVDHFSLLLDSCIHG